MKIINILGICFTTFSIISCFKPIIGTPTDNQLLSPLLALLIIIYNYFYKKEIFINKFSSIIIFIFFIASVFSILSVPFCINDNLRIIRHAITYIMGCSIILTSANLISIENVKKGCDIALIITYLGFFLQRFFPSFFGLFIYRGIYSLTNSRGLTSFFSEGGYTVATMFAIILIYYIAQKKLIFYNVFFPVFAMLISGAGQVLKTSGEFVLYSLLSFLIFKIYIFCINRNIIFKTLFNYKKVLIRSISIIILILILFYLPSFTYYVLHELPPQIVGIGTRYLTLFFSVLDSGYDLPRLISMTDDNLLFKIAGYFLVPLVILLIPFNLCPMKMWSINYYNQFPEFANKYIEAQKNIFGAFQFPDTPYLSLGSLIIDFGLLGLIGFLLILFLCFRKIELDFNVADGKIVEKAMVLGAITTVIIDNHGIGMWVTWFTLGFFFTNSSLKLRRL